MYRDEAPGLSGAVLEILKDFVEVSLPQSDSFNIVRETLTRIGVTNKEENTLFQTAHILHKRGKFYIVHFKELFKLDGKASNLSEDDLLRRNAIVWLLQEWGLLNILDLTKVANKKPIKDIKIIPHSEKSKWTLTAKYTIGKFKSKRPPVS